MGFLLREGGGEQLMAKLGLQRAKIRRGFLCAAAEGRGQDECEQAAAFDQASAKGMKSRKGTE